MADLDVRGLRYDRPMKPKPQSEEYQRFESLLGRVLTVSKEELNERLKESKREKRTPKRVSRVSDASSRER
jgi:hypothetical protein